MLSRSFNAGCNIKEGFSQPFTNLFSREQDLGTPVTLPHDAMILEKKTPDTKNGKQTGYYPGKSYLYTKMFFVPDDWLDKNIVLEFEGVYPSALVYINGDFAGSHHSGYSLGNDRHRRCRLLHHAGTCQACSLHHSVLQIRTDDCRAQRQPQEHSVL